MRRRSPPPSRPWMTAGVAPPQPASCAGCDAPNAAFGIGPPLRKRVSFYCATCNEFQPETQAALAERARAMIDDE